MDDRIYRQTARAIGVVEQSDGESARIGLAAPRGGHYDWSFPEGKTGSGRRRKRHREVRRAAHVCGKGPWIVADRQTISPAGHVLHDITGAR